jgi:prolyl oligopeptidase
MPSLLRAACVAALGVVVALPALALEYPPAPRGPVVDDYFGTAVADPYRWMEDLDSEQTRAWVKAENALSLPYLAKLPERDAFHQRLTQLWNYERFDVPVTVGSQVLYRRNDGLQNQSVLYVRPAQGGEARVLIDPNTLSKDGTVALAGYEASPDGRWLAYATAAAGSDWNEFRIRDIATGKDSAEVLTRIKFSGMSWSADGKGFIYSRYPDAPKAGTGLNDTVFDDLANRKLYYHRVGTPQAQDQLVYARPDQPKWFIDGQITDDGRYLFISLRQGSADENQLLVMDLKDPKAPKFDGRLISLVDSFDHSYSVLGNQGSIVQLLSNDAAPRRRIVSMNLASPTPAKLSEVVPQTADTIQTAKIVGDQIIMLTMHDAASRLLRYELDGKPKGEIDLPGLGAVSESLGGSADKPMLYYGFTSFNQPLSVYQVNLSGGKSSAFAPLKLAFDPTQFVTEQVFYPSRDGTRVPMFISYKKGFHKDGSARAFLHGYGGFDIPKTPAFDASALAWMEKGGVYAVANLRGGGEYGEEWHLAGTKERKQNVFDDFYYAGRYLAEQHYTTPKRIAIWGRSNGGLLVGASVNQHPDFWGAAVATVGVLDMLRFHKFTVGYAWTGDYGSSDDEAGFQYLYAYSPLHTVKPGTQYPPLLVTTGDHDDRVHPAHSFKYTAAMQAAQAGDNPVLIRIDTQAGHGGGKPTAKLIDEEADKLGFMWQFTGQTAKP